MSLNEEHWSAIEDLSKPRKEGPKQRAKRVKKLIAERDAKRQAGLREERIGEALVWASLHYDAERHCDRSVFVEPPGGADNRPGEKLIKGKTKGMKKKRGRGLSL